MGYLIVATVIGLASWGIYATFQSLRRKRFGIRWWMAFVVLTLCGLVVGIWAGVFLEYQLSQKMRVHGFPLPVATFLLEEGQWTDFVPPRAVQYGGVVANVVAITATALLPLLVAAKIGGRDNRHLGGNSIE